MSLFPIRANLCGEEEKMVGLRIQLTLHYFDLILKEITITIHPYDDSHKILEKFYDDIRYSSTISDYLVTRSIKFIVLVHTNYFIFS